MRKPLAPHGDPEQARPFRKVRSNSGTAVDEPDHLSRSSCSHFTTLSSAIPEPAGRPSGEDAQVGETKQRSGQYAPLVKMAGQRLSTRKLELEHELGRDIPLRELEAETGIGIHSLSDILNGHQKELSVGNFFALCEALKTDPLKIWYGDERRPSRRSDPPPASQQRPSTSPPAPGKKRGR